MCHPNAYAFRSHFDDQVDRSNDVDCVFDHHYRVASIPQRLEHILAPPQYCRDQSGFTFVEGERATNYAITTAGGAQFSVPARAGWSRKALGTRRQPGLTVASSGAKATALRSFASALTIRSRP